jgi:enoyl-CoA hydratase
MANFAFWSAAMTQVILTEIHGKVGLILDASFRPINSSLNEGLLFEHRVFHAAFALEDQKEGMAAFIEKRKPAFKNR